MKELPKLMTRVRAPRRDQSGVAMVEAVFVIPLLLLFFFGAFDIGRALNQYFLLSRMAYESVRLASETEGLECPIVDSAEDAPGYPTATSACGSGTGVQPAPGHCLLQQRINRMQTAMKTRLLFPVSVQTKCYADSADGNTSATTEVTLSMPYASTYLVMLPTIPINVRVSGPYLLVRKDDNQ